jgi:hypothetical protein
VLIKFPDKFRPNSYSISGIHSSCRSEANSSTRYVNACSQGAIVVHRRSADAERAKFIVEKVSVPVSWLGVLTPRINRQSKSVKPLLFGPRVKQWLLLRYRELLRKQERRLWR